MKTTPQQREDWSRGLWQVDIRSGNIRTRDPYEIHKFVILPLLEDLSNLLNSETRESQNLNVPK